MLQRKACPLNRLRLPTPMSTLTPRGWQQSAKPCHGTMSQGIHFWKALTSSLSMQIYSTFIILAQAETWLAQHWFTCWRGGESLKARILQLAWPQLLLNYDASARKENCCLSSTNFREASLIGTLLICQNCDLLGMTADKILSTLAKAGRWLSVEEQELKECCGALFMRSYVELANSQAWNVAEGLTGCIPNCICGITF